MSNIIRKLKINKIIGQELTGDDKEIYDLFIYWLSDLKEFLLDDYPNSIFYTKEGLYVLEQNEKTNNIYVRNDGFWSVLYYKYDMKHDHIQILMKGMVELIHKRKVGTPVISTTLDLDLVELILKRKVGTPDCALSRI